MNEDNNGDSGGGYGPTYVTTGGCDAKSGQLIDSIRENRNAIYGVPGGDGGFMTSVTELWSEWNTFKGLIKVLLGGSFILNFLQLLRMFNVI